MFDHFPVPRPLDIWTPAIVHCPLAELDQQRLETTPISWLPRPRGAAAFRADPFGLWRDDQLHVFVEGFDYRRRRGFIERLTFNREFDHLVTQMVLSEPWHLSYPFVLEADGDIWMLPEARRSGSLRLYRAREFPDVWEPAAIVPVGVGAVDSTPVRFDGRWWLFFAHVQTRPERSSRLSCAWAERIEGPWTPHPLNPVREGLAATRPAGTPVVRGRTIELPVQDNRKTYGGAVRKLIITRLDERHFDAHDVQWLAPPTAFDPFAAGLHTVSAAGDVTLIDCKRIDDSWRGAASWALGMIERGMRR